MNLWLWRGLRGNGRAEGSLFTHHLAIPADYGRWYDRGRNIARRGDPCRARLTTMGPGAITFIFDPILIVILDLGLDGAASAFWLSRIAMAVIAMNFVIKTHNLFARLSIKHVKRPPVHL